MAHLRAKHSQKVLPTPALQKDHLRVSTSSFFCGIRIGEFLGEFGGEVIATPELNRRKRLYDAAGVGERFCFVFDLKCGLQIDASASGNNTRYMNSVDDARANVTALLVNDFGYASSGTLWPHGLLSLTPVAAVSVRRVIFRAKRSIADGEEMCCEYSVLQAACFACAIARRDPATHALLLLGCCRRLRRPLARAVRVVALIKMIL